MTITEFLHARLAEDERTAREAQADDPTPWSAEVNGRPRLSGALPRAYSTSGLLINGETEPMWDCEGSNTLCMSGASTIHAARHSPDRVLAEAESKRMVVGLHHAEDVSDVEYGISGPPIHVCSACRFGDQRVVAPCSTLRLLALPYATHPDYDESWRL